MKTVIPNSLLIFSADCVWSWSEWSLCSQTCGPRPGKRERRRKEETPAINGGSGSECEPSIIENEDCNMKLKPCPGKYLHNSRNS